MTKKKKITQEAVNDSGNDFIIYDFNERVIFFI